MRRGAARIATQAALPAALLVGWWVWSGSNDSFFFPPLSEIVAAFQRVWIWERVGSDVVPSLVRLLAGYGLAVVGGVSVGLLLGTSRLAYRAAQPVIEFLRALPPPAIIPFGILVFGLGDGMKVIVIAAGCVWPILLNTVQGVRAIEPTYADVNRVYRVPARDRLFHTLLPASSPYIFAGLRSSLSIAVILMVLSEMTASTNGVGFFLVQSQRSFDLPEMWAAILLLGLIGSVLSLVLVLIQRRVLAWHDGARASALTQRSASPRARRRAARRAAQPPSTATGPSPAAIVDSPDRATTLHEVR